MKVLILAAGYATRLYPLTKDRPKSLLLVGKKTIMDHLLQKIEGLPEIDRIYIVSNGKFYPVFRQWHGSLKGREKVELINDGSTTNDSRLGAIGDIKLALETKNIYDDLVILAGDNMFDWDLRGFLEGTKSEPESFAIGAYEIGDKKEAYKYGVIELYEDGHVRNFLEKPQDPPSSLIATGMYYFPKDKLNLVAKYLINIDSKDAPGHFIEWLIKQEHVRCHVFRGKWFDIGDIGSYRKANLEFAEKK